MLFSILCCLLYLSMGNFLVISLFLYDHAFDLLFHHSFHINNQMHCILLWLFCNVFFCFGMLFRLFCLGILLSFLLIHWYYLLFSPTSCMTAFFWLFILFGVLLSFFMSSVFLLLFAIHLSLWFFVIIFPLISACCLVFCLGGLLSFLFIHWYFFVSPTLFMIAFHCCFFHFGFDAVFFIHSVFHLLLVVCILSCFFVILLPFISVYCSLFVWLLCV